MPLSDSPHILVIDDEPEIVQAQVLALRSKGWRVTQASDGQQGYQRAQLLMPDLILLDVSMPGMDGFAVCRLLQESPRSRDIPVLFLTSAGGSEARLEGLTHGAVDYVMKSCEPAELLARVQIHLQLVRRAVVASSSEPAELLSQDEIILRAVMRVIGEQLAELPSLESLAWGPMTRSFRPFFASIWAPQYSPGSARSVCDAVVNCWRIPA
ncbi:MAG: response regulator [Rhodanobacter sp.]